jgi:soluble lytic murein transglycosylase-like protein
MKLWVFIFLASLSSFSSATCFDEAAKRYRVPVALLKAISTVESNGNPNARNVNKNGSYDIGHMQINSSWLPTLARYGIDEKKLSDPCINTNIGAWVLAHNISRLGLSWNAVGAYNAASPEKRMVYARKVAAALRKQAES